MVQAQVQYTTGKTFVVEPDPCMAELGLSIETSLTELEHSTAQVVVIK